MRKQAIPLTDPHRPKISQSDLEQLTVKAMEGEVDESVIIEKVQYSIMRDRSESTFAQPKNSIVSYEHLGQQTTEIMKEDVVNVDGSLQPCLRDRKNQTKRHKYSVISMRELGRLTREAIEQEESEEAGLENVQSPLAGSRKQAISLKRKSDVDAMDKQRRWWNARRHIEEIVDNNILFHYICDPRYTFRRCFWFIVTVAAFSACIWKVKELTQFYLSYPLKTIHAQRYVQEMRFPAISFCNINDLRMSVMRGTLLDEAIRLQDPHQVGEESWNTTKRAAHQIEKMLVKCKFNGRQCSHQNFSTFYWKQGDRCYTFNGGKSDYKILTVKHAGPKASLELVINIEHYDYYRDRTKAGIHLIVHDQDETPVRLEGSKLSPGFSTHIKVTWKKYINLPTPYSTNCGEKKLTFFKKYSMNLCWLDSLTSRVNATCHCKDYFMPGDNIPVCNISKLMNCTWPEWEKHDLEKAFDCPLPCEINKYDHKLSSSRYPSAEHAKYMIDKNPVLKQAYQNHTGNRDEQEFLRDTMLRLVIYYENLSYDINQQKPRYETLNWIGDVGGTVALFAGMGVMTFVEIMDCVVMVTYRLFIEGKITGKALSK